MAVVDNFYFSIFLRLTWEFLGLESERGGLVCYPNNKIIDRYPFTFDHEYVRFCIDWRYNIVYVYFHLRQYSFVGIFS